MTSAIIRNGTAWFAGPKLERGNKATDWSPSPLDDAYSVFGNTAASGLLTTLIGQGAWASSHLKAEMGTVSATSTGVTVTFSNTYSTNPFVA